MPEISQNLSLPYVMPAQAQKHVTVNESLRRLDAVVQLTVKAFEATTPPALVNEGDVFALGVGAAFDWAGQDGMLAHRIENAWQFIDPQTGWRAYGVENGDLRVFDGGAWRLIKGESNNLAALGVNTTADATNRLAVQGAAALFTHEGAGHQIKINKAGVSDDALITLQTNWSTRAQFGLAGGDSFAIKVSDGSAWFTPVVIKQDSGFVGINTWSPQRALHIDDVMRLEPTSEPASPSAGDIYFDSTSNRLRCHDGTVWNDLF